MTNSDNIDNQVVRNYTGTQVEKLIATERQKAYEKGVLIGNLEGQEEARKSLIGQIEAELPKKKVKVEDIDDAEEDIDGDGRPFCATCGQYIDGEEMPEKCYCDHFNDALTQVKAILRKYKDG